MVGLHWVLNSRLDFDRDGGDKGRNSLGKASEMARPRKGRKGPVGSEARRGRSRMRLVQNLGGQLENWRFYPGGNGEPWEVFERWGGTVLLVRELSLDPMEWAIPNTLEGVEGMPLKNGNMNSEK